MEKDDNKNKIPIKNTYVFEFENSILENQWFKL